MPEQNAEQQQKQALKKRWGICYTRCGWALFRRWKQPDPAIDQFEGHYFIYGMCTVHYSQYASPLAIECVIWALWTDWSYVHITT